MYLTTPKENNKKHNIIKKCLLCGKLGEWFNYYCPNCEEFMSEIHLYIDKHYNKKKAEYLKSTLKK